MTSPNRNTNLTPSTDPRSHGVVAHGRPLPSPADAPSQFNPNYISTLPRLLTVDEVAVRFRLSKTAVYRLVAARRVAFIRVQGSLRFTEADLGRYLVAARVESFQQHRI